MKRTDPGITSSATFFFSLILQLNTNIACHNTSQTLC